MNVFRQRGPIGAVLRVIPFDIPAFDSLHCRRAIESRRPAARAGARDRPDRLGQVDDARPR